MTAPELLWVWLEPCGCLAAVLASGQASTLDEAWERMWSDRQVEREAHLAGVRLERMTNERYTQVPWKCSACKPAAGDLS